MAERSQIDEIKQRLDIVDTAKKYIRADFRNSGRNTFTTCPFHNEKTPSFSLNSDIGIYKCFGCGESGDVITFIQKLEGVDFPKAIEIAAEYAGITLKDTFTQQDKELAKKRERIIEANNITAEFYHYLLLKHSTGKEALNYVKNRKLSKDAVVEFKIGFAPKGFNNLKNLLIKKGFSIKELVDFGLLVSKNNNVYDKFRNRLMFPIFNHRGDIVGFSGRTLEKDGIPKYLNSPETIVYKKSQIIYGLFQNKNEIRQKDFAIVAEGNVDPITSRNTNYSNIVVPMGTSLTEGQLKLIKRFTDNIYFAFDSDEAGFKALERNSKIALKMGFNIRVINIGKYKDPDELMKANVDLWHDSVQNAIELVDYIIEKYKNIYNLKSASEKSKFAKVVKEYISLIQDDIQVEHYNNLLSSILDVSNKAISRSQYKKSSQSNKTEAKTENVDYIDYLLSIIINFDIENEKLNEIKFDELQNKILKIKDMVDNTKEIRAQLSEEEQVYFDNLIMINLPQFDQSEAKSEVEKEIARIKKIQSKDEISLLKEELKTIEASGGDISETLSKIQELKKILK